MKNSILLQNVSPDDLTQLIKDGVKSQLEDFKKELWKIWFEVHIVKNIYNNVTLYNNVTREIIKIINMQKEILLVFAICFFVSIIKKLCLSLKHRVFHLPVGSNISGQSISVDKKKELLKK